MNLLALPIIAFNRLRHLFHHKKRIAVREKAISTIRNSYEKSISNGMPHYEKIHNVGLYVLLLDRDISILINDALFSISALKRNYVARQLAIILYEASQDIPELLGKEFRESLKTFPLSETDWAEFNKISKSFNEFKQKNRVFLGEIRNYVSAHRDKCAAKQLEILEKIEILSLLKIGGEFYSSVRSLIPFMIKMTLLLGCLNVLLKHVPSKLYEKE